MNYSYILFGALCIAGAIYLFVTEYLKKDQNERNKIGTLGSAGIIVIGIASIVSGIFDDMSICVFISLFLLGSGIAAIGIYNLNLYHTCTKPITAIYLYSQKTGKRGENAVPVFRYTFEGKEYTSRSAQQVSAILIGTKYRIDQPCQILINPEKPQVNIVKINKPIDDIAKLVIGAVIIAGAFVSQYMGIFTEGML